MTGVHLCALAEGVSYCAVVSTGSDCCMAPFSEGEMRELVRREIRDESCTLEGERGSADLKQ